MKSANRFTELKLGAWIKFQVPIFFNYLLSLMDKILDYESRDASSSLAGDAK